MGGIPPRADQTTSQHARVSAELERTLQRNEELSHPQRRVYNGPRRKWNQPLSFYTISIISNWVGQVDNVFLSRSVWSLTARPTKNEIDSIKINPEIWFPERVMLIWFHFKSGSFHCFRDKLALITAVVGCYRSNCQTACFLSQAHIKPNLIPKRCIHFMSSA